MIRFFIRLLTNLLHTPLVWGMQPARVRVRRTGIACGHEAQVYTPLPHPPRSPPYRR